MLTHYVLAFFPSLLKGQYLDLRAPRIDGGGWVAFLQFPLVTVLYNGHFAVMVFFVLSGYVMTAPYYQGMGFILKRRILGRYIRLGAPAAFAVVCSFFLASNGWFFNVEAASYSKSLWLGTFFQENLGWDQALKSALYGSVVLGDDQFVPPIWTIQIELFGSLALMLLYLVYPERYWVALSFFLPFALWYFLREESIYYLSIYLGSLLHRMKPVKGTAFYLAILAIFLGGYSARYGVYSAMPALNFFGVTIFVKKDFYNALGAVILVQAILSGWGACFFQSRLLVSLGSISYSLYLTHFLVLCSVVAGFYALLEGQSQAIWLCLPIYLTLALAIAVLMTHLVDRHAITWSRCFAERFLG
jgi:peptidoglycan/LPS O-acetylase OafA/YrhL